MELYLKTREEWHDWLEDIHAVIPEYPNVAQRNEESPLQAIGIMK